MDAIRYGNTLQDVKRVTVVGLIMGGVVATIVFFVAYTSHKLDLSQLWIFGLLIALPAVSMLFIVGFGALFSLVIRNDKIENIFLNRYVLSSYPYNSLSTIKTQSGVFAVVLHFKDGKIRIFSMHLREVQRLIADLKIRKD